MPAQSPEHLTLQRIPTPIGTALLVTDEAGLLRALDFEDCEDRMHLLLRRHYGTGPSLSSGQVPTQTSQALQRYFEGHLTALDTIACATAGTPFQRSVWQALRSIGPGQTLSYGALATQIAAPKAIRAVGLANAQNPIGIIVPCHRVIGKTGNLTGYAGGLPRKRWLLDHEQAHHAETTPRPPRQKAAQPRPTLTL